RPGHAADPARRGHRLRRDGRGDGRRVRLRRHGPRPAAGTGPGAPCRGRPPHPVAVHPLQPLHAHHLLTYALRTATGAVMTASQNPGTYAVTGSASGIGRATADLLRAEGHTVIGVDVHAPPAHPGDIVGD